MLKKKIISLVVVGLLIFASTPIQSQAQFIDPAQLSKEFGVDTLVTIIQGRVINKLIDDSLSWANNGFDGKPGFVDNWDDFLEGTAHDSLSHAFATVNRAATRIGNSKDPEIKIAVDRCGAQNITQTSRETEALDNLFEDPITGEVPSERKVEYDNNYAQIIFESDQRARACDKIYESTDDDAQRAANNYETWSSGDLDVSRGVAETVARFGAKQLSNTGFEDLAAGRGETLTGLLGGKAEKNNFFNDVGSVGNDGTKAWQAYVAAADPHNYPRGLKTLVETRLTTETREEVSKSIDNLQSPVKFLDKTYCLRYSKEVDPITKERRCLKEKTGTPGEVISSESRESLGKEREQSYLARELSDVLAEALGRLSDGLIGVGFNQLSGAVNSAINSGGNSAGQTPGIDPAFTGSSYQNEYDVLELSNNTTSSFNREDDSDPSKDDVSPRNSTPFSSDIVDGSAPYIGGPEDVLEGLAWNEGPELIVNLQEVLELAINNTQAELAFYQDAERVIKDGQDSIKKIDRCAPGPDYNWTKRFDDQLPSNNSESDIENQRKIGKNEQISMVDDSLVNIPGAQRMRSIVVTSLAAGSNEFEEVNQTRTRKQNILASLINIRGLILEDFNTYKQEVHPNLTLFIEDWNKLTPTEQFELFSLPLRDNSGNPDTGSYEESDGTVVTYPLYLVDKYIAIKHKEGETVQSIFTSKPNEARAAVLTLAWDLWRTQKGLEPADETSTPPSQSGKKQKSNIRYRYYILKNDVSTQTDVLKAELIKDEAIQNNVTMAGFLNDCIQLKSFATGHKPEEIDRSLENPPSRFISFGRSDLDVVASTLPLVTIYEKHGREYRALDISKAKTDAEIKDFITQEKAKQEDNNDATKSVFETNLITGDGSISQSILGFEDDTEKNQYFLDFYPDDTLPDQPITRNATTIAEIYQKDYTIGTWPRNGGATGTLFCRLESVFDSRGSNRDQNLTECMKTYYRMSNLEYAAILSGI